MGYVREEFYYNYGQNVTATPFFGPNINNDRGPAGGFNLNGVGSGQSDFTMRTRAVITVDTRQQTDYGVVRTYVSLGHTGDSPTPQSLFANRGFIQFTGFTFGLAESFFNSARIQPRATLQTTVKTAGMLAGALRPSANFGNGIPSTLSLEEPRRIGVTAAAYAGSVAGSFNPNSLNLRTQFNDPFLVGTVVPQATGNIIAPDIVYNWRIDQQRGAIMLGGALTDVRGGSTTAPMQPTPVPG